MTVFAIVVSIAAMAQPQPRPQEKNVKNDPRKFTRVNPEALKIAFITRELNLTAEESQKFWPVHNAYMEEMKNARKTQMGNEIAFEEKALAIRKKYNADFKKILNSDERANRIFQAEKGFNHVMGKEWIERRKKMMDNHKRMMMERGKMMDNRERMNLGRDKMMKHRKKGIPNPPPPPPPPSNNAPKDAPKDAPKENPKTPEAN